MHILNLTRIKFRYINETLLGLTSNFQEEKFFNTVDDKIPQGMQMIKTRNKIQLLAS